MSDSPAPSRPGRMRLVRRLFLLAVLAGAAIDASACGQNTSQSSPDCGPVTDSSFVSPNGETQAHLMNQYCAYGFGVANNTFWVVLGNEVAKAGSGQRVDQLGPEDRVVFKTITFAPTVSWRGNDSLIITIGGIAAIQKSLHSLENVRIEYKIPEQFSREKYLGRLRDSEPGWLFSRDLDEYETFQKWATENAK